MALQTSVVRIATPTPTWTQPSTIPQSSSTAVIGSVSVSDSVLPTGAATSAAQATLLTELQAKADLTETQPVSMAEADITSKYKITDIDASTPAYYSYVAADGSWYIMKDDSGAYRYAKGASSYTTNWTGRAGLSYDYFYTTF